MDDDDDTNENNNENNNEVGQVVQDPVSRVANNNEVGQVVQGLVSSVANMNGGTVSIEKEINLCSISLNSISELDDFQSIINSIKTNRYFYDTLYVLFINCLNKLIILEKSKIKIKIDKLPANYTIDSDFYYTQLSIQLGFNIEIIIKEKMRYLCYTVKNRKQIKQLNSSMFSMFSTNERTNYMNSLKYNIERMNKEQEKFVRAVDEKNYSPDKLRFIPLSIGSSNKETLLSFVDKFLVNKSILKELIQKIKDSCDRGILYCNEQHKLINNPEIRKKIEQFEEQIINLEESILENNHAIDKYKETINLIYKKHLFDFFKYIQKQKIIIRKKELELKNSDNASKKSKLETEINKLKQTLDKLEENYIAVKNKFLKDENIKKLVINVVRDMHKYKKELSSKFNNTSKLNEMNRKLNEMSEKYKSVSKYSRQFVKETKINTRTKSNTQIIRIIDAYKYNIRINEKQIIKKQDQINEIKKQIKQIKQLQDNLKEQNEKLKEQKEKFKKIQEETDKISSNNTQKTTQKIEILTKKFDELKTLLRLIKTKGQKQEMNKNNIKEMNENQLQKHKKIEEIIKKQDSDINKITSEINLLKQRIKQPHLNKTEKNARYEELTKKIDKLKELEQNYKYRNIKEKQIEINETESILRKLATREGRDMIRTFITKTVKNERNKENEESKIRELSSTVLSITRKSDIQIVKDFVNRRLNILKGQYIDLLENVKNETLPNANSVKANEEQEREQEQGQSNQGQASQGQSSQGQANDEIIIKTVLGTPNKSGRTIEKQFESIFTELQQYNNLLSKDIRIFMDLASSGFGNLIDYTTNTVKLITELNNIIDAFNSKTTNKRLQQKLTKYSSTKNAVITKLSKCKDELTKLNDFIRKYKDFVIIYSKSHKNLFKEFNESSNKKTKQRILDDIIDGAFRGFLSRIGS